MTPYKCQNGDVVLVSCISHDDVLSDQKVLPAVVISGNVVNDNLSTVLVCPLIKEPEIKRSRIGALFVRGKLIGLPHDSVMSCMQIFTIFQDQIIKRIGALPESLRLEVQESLTYVFSLEDR